MKRKRMWWWSRVVYSAFYWCSIRQSCQNDFDLCNFSLEIYRNESPFCWVDGITQEEEAHGREKNLLDIHFHSIRLLYRILENCGFLSCRKDLRSIWSALHRQLRISIQIFECDPLPSQSLTRHDYVFRRNLSKLEHCSMTNVMLTKSRNALAKCLQCHGASSYIWGDQCRRQTIWRLKKNKCTSCP